MTGSRPKSGPRLTAWKATKKEQRAATREEKRLARVAEWRKRYEEKYPPPPPAAMPMEFTEMGMAKTRARKGMGKGRPSTILASRLMR
jgi:hypothetical protein